ncbi:MAG: hypothetical protein ACPGU7_13545 [Gammaproteobacteria bacterium]
MRPVEAERVGALLEERSAAELSPCLNLGSSTASFRATEQPHIDAFIFEPLAARGVEVIHADIKMAAGVDIAGDIYTTEVMAEIQARSPRCVMCCNMFEHVEDREGLAGRLDAMLPGGGLLLITVPFSYPIHYDPIDTGFRPSPEEVAALFPSFKVVESDVVSDETYGRELVRTLGLLGAATKVLKSVAKFFMFWRGKRFWVQHFHRYLWLFRPYKVSCVLLRKAGG